jgi:nucleoside-diphosphate-sugar epimerase
MTLLDLGRVVAETLDHPFKPLRLPAAPFFWAAALCEAVCHPLGLTPPIYRRRVAFFTKDRSFDTRKVQQTLEWQPSRSNGEGIRETALAYRKAGWL